MEQASAEAESLSAKQREILLNLPNMPQADIPVGRDAADNPVVRTHGEKPVIANPKDHVVLAESLGLIDPDRATKISGSGFAVYTGQGARLERALLNFLIDTHTREHGYTEVSTPFVVRRECMVGTGQLPKFEEALQKLSLISETQGAELQGVWNRSLENGWHPYEIVDRIGEVVFQTLELIDREKIHAKRIVSDILVPATDGVGLPKILRNAEGVLAGFWVGSACNKMLSAIEFEGSQFENAEK
jgi:seryl-tRNA synthetase